MLLGLDAVTIAMVRVCQSTELGVVINVAWEGMGEQEVLTQFYQFRNKYNIIFQNGSRDNAVGIATGYGLDGRGVGIRVPVGSKIHSLPGHSDWYWGRVQPLIQ
jgi:hypothetical protein